MVVSRGQPLRRRWLVDALGAGVEVVDTRVAPWTAARADVVALLREDCLPAPGWCERAVAVARAHPGAIVQGAVLPDPHQVEVLLAAPDLTALDVRPPRTWAPLANVVATRATLEGVLDDPADGGAAAGARLRAASRAAGVPWVADPGLLVWSSVARPEPVRGAAAAVRSRPELRRELTLGVFTSHGHLRLVLALAALAAGPRAAPLLAPWLLTRRYRDGSGARGRVRALARLPGRTLADARSLGSAAAASARERTLVL